MQQPGLSRAVPMGVLGFLVGALLVILVRGLQSLDPIWDVGTGIVFGTFFCAGFFVWGIGAFDLRLSAHGEEAEHALAEAGPTEPSPFAVFTSSLWQVIFAVVVLIVVLAVASKLGPAVTTTTNNAASTLNIGFLPAQIAGQDVQISTAVVLAAFLIIVFVSLVIAAAIFSWLFGFLARGVNDAKIVAAGGTVALPAPKTAPAARRPLVGTIITLVKAVVLFAVLYAFFYFVAIGLILPKPEWQLEMLSFVNALIITVLIMRPSILIFILSRISRWVANLMRGGNLRGGHKIDGTQKVTKE